MGEETVRRCGGAAVLRLEKKERDEEGFEGAALLRLGSGDGEGFEGAAVRQCDG